MNESTLNSIGSLAGTAGAFGGPVGAAIGGGVQLGLGLYNAIHGAKERKKAQAALESAMNARPDFQISQEAKDIVTNQQNALNAGNPAIDALYKQNQIAAANTMANAQRNATSGTEAMQAAANAQAMQMAQNPQLAQLQMQSDIANRGQLTNALLNMQQQKLIKAQDMLDKNQMWQTYRAGQMAAAADKIKSGQAGLVQGLNSLGNSQLVGNLLKGMPSGGAGQQEIAGATAQNAGGVLGSLGKLNWLAAAGL